MHGEAKVLVKYSFFWLWTCFRPVHTKRGEIQLTHWQDGTPYWEVFNVGAIMFIPVFRQWMSLTCSEHLTLLLLTVMNGTESASRQSQDCPRRGRCWVMLQFGTGQWWSLSCLMPLVLVVEEYFSQDDIPKNIIWHNNIDAHKLVFQIMSI